MTKRKHDFEDLASSFGLDAEKELLESTAVEKVVQPTLETIASIPAFEAIEERIGSFNYEQLDVEGRQFLLERQRRIVRIIGTAVIKTGSELRLAKAFIHENCEKGSWTKWLQTALDFGEQTARNYINSSIWAETSPTVGVLSPTAIYEGASAPAEVKTQILRMIEAGEIPLATKIKEMVREHKAEVADATVQGESDKGGNKNAALVKYPHDDVVSIAEEAEPVGKSHHSPQKFEGLIEGTEAPEDSTVQSESAKRTLAVRSSDVYENVDLDVDHMVDVTSQATADRAAIELVARLREVFEDDQISEIVELWSSTTLSSVLAQLQHGAS